MASEIAWWTSPGLGIAQGYGYTAVSMIEALQRKGVKVWFDSADPKCHISFIQPQMYRGSREQYRIGYTPWESTEVPQYWIEKMREMDEVWTTSQFCKEVYDKYEVNDVVRCIPHGIDQEMWKIEDRYVGDHFNFLHVGGSTERKGGQKVVDAFLELYEGDPFYQLIMKSNGPSEARWSKGGKYMGNISSHPQVKVIESKLTTDQLVALYNKAHCMVYPSSGEGWGMIPWQAISTGMPTICTNATGMTEFAELSLPLNWEWTEGNGIHLGLWAEPDLNHLRELMTHVVENFNEVKVKTMNSAKVVHATQTWDDIATLILETLGDRVDQVA